MIPPEQKHPLGPWGTPRELEIRRRIQISVAAYAYEIADSPIMSDRQYDWFAERICRNMGTCHPLLDEFFTCQFSPMTGMWIRTHPQLDGIKRAFEQHSDALRGYYRAWVLPC